MGNSFVSAFLPNHTLSKRTFLVLVAFQGAIALCIWVFSPFAVLPRPGEVAEAFGRLWLEQGLSRELGTSVLLNIEALAITTAIALTLAYATAIPFFRPIAGAVTKLRFLGLAGLTFAFTLMFGGGRPLKLSLLVFGISVFLVTSMVDVVTSIPKDKFDHARTLRMNEWQVIWYVVIRGTRDKMVEVLRQNAAIGWVMLTMVEGISRAEGGIGALLLNQDKHFHLAEVFAVQIVILAVGLCLDYTIGVLRNVIAPYANLTLERR